MRILLLSFMLCFTIKTSAQDTIYLLNNNKVIAKIKGIDAFNITYRKNDSTSKRDMIIPKNQVRLVAYSNGSFIICSVRKINPAFIKDYPMFLKGVSDATIYYKHPGGSIATGITSFLTGGLLGLIPAIACSATQPKVVNLGLPPGAAITNKDYMLGYISKAKKMKQSKVWTCYGMGLGAILILVLVTER